MSGKAGYKGIDFDTWLSERLTTPKRRAEFEAGLIALKFGVACCMRREELGLKQKDLEPFGIPRETVCRIEKGDRLPDTKTQPKLAAALQARIIVEPTGAWKLEPVQVLDKRPKLPNESARFDALTPSATGYQYPTTTSTPHSRPRPHLVPSSFQGEGQGEVALGHRSAIANSRIDRFKSPQTWV